MWIKIRAWLPLLIIYALTIVFGSAHAAVATVGAATIVALLIFGGPVAYDLLVSWRTRRDLPQRDYWHSCPSAPLAWPRLASLALAVGLLFPSSVWLAVARHLPEPILVAWFYSGFLIIAPVVGFVVPDMVHDLRMRRREQRAAGLPPGHHDQATLNAETIRDTR